MHVMMSICTHYDRNCKLFCTPCDKYFSCRFCHDEIADITHIFNRFDVNSLQCNFCDTCQPVSNLCSSCGVTFGKYFCNICNFFDNNVDKDIFHCDKCGICRVGKSLTFHCHECNCCYNISKKDTHKCQQDNLQINCPICLENMFNSTKSVEILKCGHIIHNVCLFEYLHSNYKCPLCNKSIYDMKENFDLIEKMVNDTEMPDEYKKKVNILCNDCNKISNVDFHFIAMKCIDCNSFNTKIS